MADASALWWQVDVIDPEDLITASFINLVLKLQSEFYAPYVAVMCEGWLASTIGVSKVVSRTHLLTTDVCTLVDKLEGTIQVDYGTFFFCETATQANSVEMGPTQYHSLHEARYVIRCFDGWKYIIYSREEAIKNFMVQVYDDASVRHEYIENLEFPY